MRTDGSELAFSCAGLLKFRCRSACARFFTYIIHVLPFFVSFILCRLQRRFGALKARKEVLRGLGVQDQALEPLVEQIVVRKRLKWN